MNILVTGGTGYIGSNLVKSLLKEEHKVFLLKRKNSKSLVNDKRVIEVLYDGTYCSLEKINEKVDMIIHLATCFLVNHKTENIEDLLNANILLGTHLLEYASKHNIKDFINTETYAESITGIEYNPQNLYSATKKAFKDILKYYVDFNKMRCISLVLSDTYGPNDIRKKFLNLVLEVLKSENNEFKMSPGEQEICYIYIDDVITAYIEAIKLISKLEEKDLKTYSVFGNEILTLNSLVELLEGLYNKKLKIEKGFYSYRLREIMKFNYSSIERLPNWSPKVSLKDGVKFI